MPGVIYGEKWSNRNTRESDFGSYSSRNMSPQRKHDMKNNSVSQYSNGYSSDRTNDNRDEYPTYLLEHLATFSVGAQYGIQTPKDGLRRLLQMEKSSGIWTQKMQMRLEKKWIIIIDNENGDIVERFPMNLIAEPTSYTSNDPRELYNNVIVFIVKDDPKNKNHNPPEMHIFQCARVSAQEVVNEMKMFINGKWKPGQRERYIPPPPLNPPPEPPVNGVSVREQVNLFNAVAAAAASPPRGDGMIQRVSASGYHKMERMDNSSERNASYSRDSNDETSSTSSEKYERDVAILNHCFDDIERFIARLQHAAAAFKELERRQKSRKNKKKDMGDGMLSIRAKPPSEREFVDVLQKFKLSFNLLAKLKNHIHDPNAPELVHFLFTPLALIIDAAKDSNYSTALASRVMAPLLTRDAIELLMNCCTSKESDLWHSLGDSWIVPRDQWKGFEGSYHPVFSDGWAPENPFSEKRERAEATAAAAAAMAQKYRREETRRSQDEQSEMRHSDYRVPSRNDRESRYGSEFHYSDRGERERPLSPLHAPEPPHSSFENRFYDQNLEGPRRDPFERNGAITPVSDHDFGDHRDRDMRSDFSADSIDHVNPLDPHRQFETQQKQWLDDMKSRSARIVQVMYPRTANNDKELTVVRGELLEVIDDSRKWWKARNARGQVAHVPHTIVGPFSSTEDDAFNNPIYGSRGNGTKEPYYTPSDSPVGRERPSENGHRDPAANPKPHPPIPTPAPADWIKRERQGKKDKKVYEEIEAAVTIDESHETSSDKEPTSKLILKADNSSVPKSKTLPRTASMMDTLHEELKMRVTLGSKAGKKYGLVERQSTFIHYITPQSTPAEIQLWLDSKGFSARTQQVLQNMKGETIFSLSKSQMEHDLGLEEGTRLFKQMTIQKNVCNFKTCSAIELSSILEARRKRIDPDEFVDEKTEERKPSVTDEAPETKDSNQKTSPTGVWF